MLLQKLLILLLTLADGDDLLLQQTALMELVFNHHLPLIPIPLLACLQLLFVLSANTLILSGNPVLDSFKPFGKTGGAGLLFFCLALRLERIHLVAFFPVALHHLLPCQQNGDSLPACLFLDFLDMLLQGWSQAFG